MKSISQRRFHGRPPLSDRKVPNIHAHAPDLTLKKSREFHRLYAKSKQKPLKMEDGLFRPASKINLLWVFLRDINNRVNVFTLGCLPIATLKPFQTGISTYPCGNKSYLRITHF